MRIEIDMGSITPITEGRFEEWVEIWGRCILPKKGFWYVAISLSKKLERWGRCEAVLDNLIHSAGDELLCDSVVGDKYGVVIGKKESSVIHGRKRSQGEKTRYLKRVGGQTWRNRCNGKRFHPGP